MSTLLAALLRVQYGLAVDRLEPAPRGWTGETYHVTSGGTHYFVKVYPADRLPPTAAPVLPALTEPHRIGLSEVRPPSRRWTAPCTRAWATTSWSSSSSSRPRGWFPTQAWQALEEIARACRAARFELVLTHGDWPFNLLRGRNGALHLVDWDELLLAPAERDTWFAAGDPNPNPPRDVPWPGNHHLEGETRVCGPPPRPSGTVWPAEHPAPPSACRSDVVPTTAEWHRVASGASGAAQRVPLGRGAAMGLV